MYVDLRLVKYILCSSLFSLPFVPGLGRDLSVALWLPVGLGVFQHLCIFFSILIFRILGHHTPALYLVLSENEGNFHFLNFELSGRENQNDI